MGDTAKDINMMELLLKISNDVSSIKTDMANFKEAQKLEKENTARELEDVRCDCKKEVTELEERITENTLEIEKLKKRIEELERADDTKDAKKWRAVMIYIMTALGGMFVAKLPDIAKALIEIFTN
jgi:TolA-binding protein